ncbi:hypothetical protein TOTORO_00170 [Serratia phage vB_SmaS-Totoro]|nr:hypothetical protein TOTORO_00170 [Serratia phage vB_SmaS-Totoro]
MSADINNPFNRPASHYKRNIDVITGYIEQNTLMLHKSTGMPMEQCEAFVREELFNGPNKMKDPDFLLLERDDELDQKPRAVPFTKYIETVTTNGWLLAPTFTTVLPPHIKQSLLSEYIKGNLSKRSAEKHLMFEAERKGNGFKATFHKNNQNNKKILNNAISGNHRSEHSPLHDRSTHPVLTSCCRIANGSANSNDDRLLSGNRHYWKPEVVMNNISSILSLSNWDEVEEAVVKHNLHIPTVDEVMEVIRWGSDLYWGRGNPNSPAHRTIRKYVEGCTDIERAGIVYTGDLYHLRKYNEPLVRDFISGLVTPATEIDPDHEAWLKHVDDDTIAQMKVMFPHILLEEDLWDDYEEVSQREGFGLMGTTCKQIYQKLDKYKEIINVFFMSKNIPFLTCDFPHSIRRSGVGSDTDSAIFTVQDWVQWYSGHNRVNHENIIIAESMGFIVSQTTTHNLASLAGNIGVVEPKEVFRLSMKNEYLFPIFTLTSRAKHYFANMAVQEGVIFKKYKREKKGVELIASNSPAGVRADLDRIIEEITDLATADKKINLSRYLRWIARWEYSIYDSVRNGEVTYLKAARVKEEDGYEGENSPYLNYELWQEVFGPKYGMIEPPPYSALSFSIMHDTKKKTENWLNSWKDQEMADRFRKWLASKGKGYVGRLLLPESIIISMGIPEEILDAIDVRKIIGSAMSPMYLVMESLDYYLFDSNQTRLIFDHIDRDTAFMDVDQVESALRTQVAEEFD